MKYDWKNPKPHLVSWSDQLYEAESYGYWKAIKHVTLIAVAIGAAIVTWNIPA